MNAASIVALCVALFAFGFLQGRFFERWERAGGSLEEPCEDCKKSFRRWLTHRGGPSD